MKVIRVRNTQDGMKVAKCFGYVVQDYMRNPFVNLSGHVVNYRDQIDIPIEAQPCIYACMKYGMKVEVEWEEMDEDYGSIGYDFERLKSCEEFFSDSQDLGDVKSIKLLNLDQMEGLEVVG